MKIESENWIIEWKNLRLKSKKYWNMLDKVDLDITSPEYLPDRTPFWIH